MRPAVGICHIRQLSVQQMILLQTVRDKDPFIIPVEIQGLFVATSLLVLLDHYRTVFIELSGTVHPHIAHAVGAVTVPDHLCRSLV